MVCGECWTNTVMGKLDGGLEMAVKTHAGTGARGCKCGSGLVGGVGTTLNHCQKQYRVHLYQHGLVNCML